MIKEYSSKELFRAGIQLLKEKEYGDALISIKMAIRKGGYKNLDEIPTLYLSYLGLVMALAEKRYRNGFYCLINS